MGSMTRNLAVPYALDLSETFTKHHVLPTFAMNLNTPNLSCL